MSSVVRSVTPQPPRRPRHYGRWLAIAVISALVHLAAIDALPHWTIAATDDEPNGEPLRAILMPPITPTEVPKPPVPTTTTPPEPAAPPPRATPVRPKAAPAIRRPARVPDEPIVSAGPPQADAEPAAGLADARPVATPPAPAPAPAPPPVAASPPTPAPPPMIPPRSARLDYQVVSQNAKESNPIYGKGTITWAFADGHYATDLTAAADVFLFKVDVLSSRSEGSIGADGLEPDRYTESPRRRATVATNFNRDARQSITFSASSANAPLVPGAQDRLSVLFQLGALLLADARSGIATTAIDIPVAGVRGDVERWSFEARGMETLDTGAGPLSTTHLQRAARPGTNDRTIDVWVAQSNGGYPARVLYTEPNGNTVMMTLDRITALH